MQFRLVLEIGLSMLCALLFPSEALISLGFTALLLLPPPAPPTLLSGSRLRSGSGRAGVAGLEWSGETIYRVDESGDEEIIAYLGFQTLRFAQMPFKRFSS
jgi:hypothetical protein